MKTLKPTAVFLIIFAFIMMLSCNSEKSKPSGQKIKNTHITLLSSSMNPFSNTNVVEVVSEGMDFQVIDEIKSGWTTFRYKNLSTDTHFFILEKFPPGKSVEDSKKEVIPVFQEGMDLINQGKTEDGYAAFAKLPKWYFDVGIQGGSGLVSPGNISETTVKLDPGYYVMECYVKMADGKFHSYYGMLKGLRVTQDKNNNKEPKPTVKMAISAANGIEFNPMELKKGKQIIAVEFLDQKPHENFMGHDVHLVKLGNNVDLKELDSWMNWANPKGFISPSPKGFTFLGGCQELDSAKTGYFKADLKPGNYAFVSEVPGAQSKKMLKTFTVSN